MDKKGRKFQAEKAVVAPGVVPEDSFGEKATKSEIDKGESTTITRLAYDEYDPSE
ncbi:hypothetical protein [Oceanobacillus piezotolerans]|uniref:hypothetical protein n=1 Tax=Oceanobacillus piezotolerans TaxID=2448030 RepID=UPI001314A0AD|nr:hypothetical protein [Oceanobacillus piezotolerans]